MKRSNSSPPGRWPIPVDTDVAAAFALLNDDQKEFFTERAGVAQHDAGFPLAEAERRALQATREFFGLSSDPPR